MHKLRERVIAAAATCASVAALVLTVGAGVKWR